MLHHIGCRQSAPRHGVRQLDKTPSRHVKGCMTRCTGIGVTAEQAGLSCRTLAFDALESSKDETQEYGRQLHPVDAHSLLRRHRQPAIEMRCGASDLTPLGCRVGGEMRRRVQVTCASAGLSCSAAALWTAETKATIVRRSDRRPSAVIATAAGPIERDTMARALTAATSRGRLRPACSRTQLGIDRSAGALH